VIIVRVFVAGGTGVVGRRLVTQLVARGHEVTATTTTAGKLDLLAQLGAEGVVMDGLDAASVGEAVGRARPDTIVHEMTAISPGHSGKPDFKHMDRWFAGTNRLRTEGTDHLLAAAAATGVPHVVAQSFASFNGVRSGGWVKTEDDPLDLLTGTPAQPQMEAIRHLETAVLDAGGAVLRYGGFYGPGTSMAPGEQVPELIRKRRFPLVGDGSGVWSFIHVADAAEATVAAIERGRRGVYNVVDDDPAPMREWLPAFADALGAKPPRRVPLWLARPFAGANAQMSVAMRGASNEKAKRELGWLPHYGTWRVGFREGLG
jgi:nucleoside-diphosphate-sugar epimerase